MNPSPVEIDHNSIASSCPARGSETHDGEWSGRRRNCIRAGKLFATAFVAILGLFSAAEAQRIASNATQGARSQISVNASVIEGSIKDITGAVIPDATIVVTNSSGQKIESRSDENGRFRLVSLILDRGDNRIQINAKGFRSFAERFSVNLRESINYATTLNRTGVTNWVEVVSRPDIDVRKSETSSTFRVGRN